MSSVSPTPEPADKAAPGTITGQPPEDTFADALDFTPAAWKSLRPWVVGPHTPELRLVAAFYALALLTRWALVPGQGPQFGAWTALASVAAIGIGTLRGRLWWLLAVCAMLGPLIFLRDWLTQSALMAALGTAGLLCANPNRDDTPTLRTTMGVIVALTYLLSAFHKTNHDFFDPVLSCANEGWERMRPWLGSLTDLPLRPAMPALTWLAEVALGVLVLTAPRLGLAAAAAFHIPLTLTFEPSFPFAMFVGFVAVGATRLLQPTQFFRAAVASCAVLGIVAGVGSVSVEAPLAVPDLALRVGLMASIGLWAVWPRQPATPSSTNSGAPAVTHVNGSAHLQTNRAAGLWPRLACTALVLVWMANGMTPYLTTQTQHTGAMLSNLRVDSTCWNHAIIPASFQRVDPYVRIDDARVGQGDAAREHILRTTLWSTTALLQMRRNWCPRRDGPIVLTGSFLGRPLHIADLCNPAEPLPTGPGVWFGAGIFPDWLRLQKNLPRACHAACMH
jgi:hypothetical protein